MRGLWCVLGLVVAGLTLPGSAGAVGTGTLDAIKLPGAANSVTQASDGSIWVSLFARRTAARIAPDGTITESADLGGAPAGVTFVEGKVWVAVTSAKKVVQFDPGSVDTFASTATAPGSCGPVAVAGTGNGTVFVSQPNDGTTATCSVAVPSTIQPISAAGAAAPAIPNRGQAFDLVASSGVLWVPDFGGDVLRRLAPDASLTVGATYPLPAGAGATGVGVATDGTIAVSLASSGSVARIAPTAAPGTAADVFATGIASPAGVGSAHGSLYVAGSGLSGGSPTIRRFPSDGSIALPITPLASAQPWDVSPGPDGTVLFTDLASERLIRFTSRPPRVTTGALFNATTTWANVDLVANPGGNAAVTTVDYGLTPAYGSSAVAMPIGMPAQAVAAGTADVALRAGITGLKAGTTYHYRAVVVTPEGTAVGEDRTFTTAASDPPSADARPKVTLTRSSKRGVHKVTKIRVTGLTSGERITVVCSGKGCPTRKKDRTVKVTAKRAGSLTVAAKKITSAKLGKGAKVTVTVARSGSTMVIATASVSKKNRWTTKTECILQGATKRSAC